MWVGSSQKKTPCITKLAQEAKPYTPCLLYTNLSYKFLVWRRHNDVHCSVCLWLFPCINLACPPAWSPPPLDCSNHPTTVNLLHTGEGGGKEGRLREGRLGEGRIGKGRAGDTCGRVTVEYQASEVGIRVRMAGSRAREQTILKSVREGFQQNVDKEIL